MRTMVVLATVALGLGVTGCPKKEKKEEAPKVTRAGGILEARSGSKITGNAIFEPTGDGRLKLTINVQNVTPGDHAVHVHETGDCSALDASSAGGHFNPDEMEHGAPGAPEHHAGDLGNMNVKEDGTGSMTVTTKSLELKGKRGVIGKALIVHERPDDMKTQPTGGAGGRIGCAVIKAM